MASNPIFNVLNPAAVIRHEFPLARTAPIAAKDGASLGLNVTAFAVPGKIAL